MYETIIIVILFVTSLEKVSTRRRITDWDVGFLCHSKCPEFNCACEDEDWISVDPECIPYAWLCDAEQDCSNRADEIDCICLPDHHQCGSDRGGKVERLSDVYNCIRGALVGDSNWDCWSGNDDKSVCDGHPNQCDGRIDCQGGSDEMNCAQCPLYSPIRCACNKPDAFTCVRGRTCYHDEEKCDGNIHCSDGSDEEDCTCREDQFICDCHKTVPRSCSIRGCISVIRQCDGRVDCSDGSDEEGCTCGSDQFTCNCYKTDPKSCFAQGCLSMSQHCDGNFDCSDGSDEKGCTCGDDQFSCDCYKADPKSCYNKGCILPSQHCDGTQDCSDGSDEVGCTYCRDDQFTCNCYKTDFKSCSTNPCVSISQYCDGLLDCSDGSDEKNCNACRDDQFKCDLYKTNPKSSATNGCIPMSWVCDGNLDCSNGLDEKDCTTCDNNEFTCDCYKMHFKSCSTEGCISMKWVCDGELDCSDGSDEEGCTCKEDLFTCDCYKTDPKSCSSSGCISKMQQCDGQIDCSDGSDEGGCTCRDDQFSCECHKKDPRLCSNGGCISSSQHCDGHIQCSDGSDEEGCTCTEDFFTCDCYKTDPKSCSGRGCISISKHCDAQEDCSDGSDETSCNVCRDDFFTCDCYKTDPKSCSRKGCIPMSWHCDGYVDCSDGSDEDGCTCTEDQFTCDCYQANHKFCSSKGCIKFNQFLNGHVDCEDGSDEPIEYFTNTKSGNRNILIRRLATIQQCDIYTDCDNSSCVNVPALNCTENSTCNTSQVICTSRYNKANSSQLSCSIFQCANGQLEIADKFCDGTFDCSDRSDEVRNQPGFKCSASFGRCVLPQRNLFDGVAQCKDGSDLCSDIPCFECLDRRLIISETQLCDGIIDCFDLSDECLCELHFRTPICEEVFVLNDATQLKCGSVNMHCHEIYPPLIEIAQCQNQSGFNQNNITTNSLSLASRIRCKNKLGEIRAVTCDGRPECKDFSDECSCENPPMFCSDHCHNFYPLGDRYCNGKIDEAWKFINDSSCPEGFDEESCPQRFTCKAGILVNIDSAQICDGNINCDDGSDEDNCNKSFRETIFSSQTEMIANVALRTTFWVMSFVVIIGNSIVIILTTRVLKMEGIEDYQRLNHVLILNLSISDILMGIYLSIISAKSTQFSGIYGDIEYEWRTSLECSIIGSLAVISSETSCFILSLLTAFRLYNVFNPFTARTASTLKWKIGIVFAWLVSLALALFPVFKTTSNSFVHEIWFSNRFTLSKGWNKTDVMTFACRLASFTNQTFESKGNTWESTKNFLRDNFPEYSPLGEVGYYGETSVCMPRIYTLRGDEAWAYSIVYITFNFISFLFVAISYILIYYKASDRPIQNSKTDEKMVQMQRRIARLIVTDFACWIPICVMVYLTAGGVEISNVVYTVTAGVLLPINSALNPLLYSPFVENLFENLRCKKITKDQKDVQLKPLN